MHYKEFPYLHYNNSKNNYIKCILVNDVKQNFIKINSTKKLNENLRFNAIKIYDKSRANENERSTPLIFHIIFK